MPCKLLASAWGEKNTDKVLTSFTLFERTSASNLTVMLKGLSASQSLLLLARYALNSAWFFSTISKIPVTERLVSERSRASVVFVSASYLSIAFFHRVLKSEVVDILVVCYGCRQRERKAVVVCKWPADLHSLPQRSRCQHSFRILIDSSPSFPVVSSVVPTEPAPFK